MSCRGGISPRQALAYENDPSTIPAGAVFDIVDTGENIGSLTASEISQLSSQLSVSSMTATDAPVTFTPSGPEQAALKSAGIHITAEINAQEVIQLDTQHNMSGSPTLVPSADPRRASALRGYVDDIGPRCIEGWAQDVDAPEAPVCLDIYAGGKLLGQALANLYREDLAAAGLGSGRHAFTSKCRRALRSPPVRS